MPNLDRFLDLIEQEARRTLSPEETAQLVREVREHLDASIQARLEMGTTLECAEREALEVFGSAHEIGNEFRKREPRFDHAFVRASLAVVGAYAFGAAFAGPLIPFLIVWMIAHFGFFRASYRARGIQWATFVAILIPAWLGSAVWTASRNATVDYPIAGPRWTVRADVERTVEYYRQSVADGSISAPPESFYEALRRAPEAPVLQEIPQGLLYTGRIGLSVVAIYGSLHLGAWSIGARRRRQKERVRA